MASKTDVVLRQSDGHVTQRRPLVRSILVASLLVDLVPGVIVPFRFNDRSPGGRPWFRVNSVPTPVRVVSNVNVPVPSL